MEEEATVGEVSFLKEMAVKISGRGNMNLQYISEKTNAKVFPLLDVEPERDVFRIVGTKQQVNEAMDMIHRLAKDIDVNHGYPMFWNKSNKKERDYKTELCPYYLGANSCVNGETCEFAHGAHELREKN